MTFETILAKIFGTKHEREVKAMRPMIAAINDLEPQIQALSDEELAAQTVTFKEQLCRVGTIIIIPADEQCPIGTWQMVPRPKRVHEQIQATIARAKQGQMG